MGKNKHIYVFFIIILIISCTKNKFKKIDNIKLKFINKIQPTSQKKISHLSKYAISNKGNIYIYDETVGKIFLFDKEGNLLSSFGSPGKGPGEFLDVVSLIPLNNSIVTIDFDKRSLIKYNDDGDFIYETNCDLKYLQNSIYYKKNIICWFRTWFSKNDNYYEKRGIGIFSDSLIIQYCIDSKTEIFNPRIINPNKIASVLDLDINNGNIACSEIDSKKFKIFIFNLKTKKLIKKIYLNLNPIKYSKREYKNLSKYYQNKMELKNLKGKYSLKKIEKKKRLIKGLSFDNYSNLWVLTNSLEGDKLYIFDKSFNVKGYIKVNKFGKIFIIQNILINVYENDDNFIFEIYKIIKDHVLKIGAKVERKKPCYSRCVKKPERRTTWQRTRILKN
ncbi:MAG: 6-bladed beta-propeller [Candidatus Cloacimonetes bacterium]|nr:6-bladed beta-propeller [Candidatus Cloacimonadota bacterium]MBS3768556.1 6-bladed beta-propeller [Candidatus Cloacimonadota bacterium]